MYNNARMQLRLRKNHEAIYIRQRPLFARGGIRPDLIVVSQDCFGPANGTLEPWNRWYELEAAFSEVDSH